MSVLVSNPSLATAVSNAGGIGTLGGTGVSPDEIYRMVSEARKLTDKPLAINIMVAANNFLELVKASIRGGIDIIVAGAGISKQLFQVCKEADVEVIPIVSSLRIGKFVEKMGASAIVVESVEAGGHLGTDKTLDEIFSEIKQGMKIPVIAAGGLVDGNDIGRMLMQGADGVQLATRFVLSDECDVHDNYKKVYLDAKAEDITTIMSPVGYPGRAITTPFVERFAKEGKIPVPSCNQCLKSCSHTFCILDALLKARDGNINEGLFFSGQNVHRIDEILPVSSIMEKLVKETQEFLATQDQHQ
ncbi:NAD(P)H-dependent flavin oxidoreductase YrpB (nitropropane dioxygenase family) [Desulfurispira natronophila]|uniref:NAD(P)H-dependent flavin oxidoreductase YrpB (Nitropropane dioxygenase family) n=2 Tax=Desulfurispira natronophila TaxID=682562 RepID=A0A7W7Y2A8_9BACT|nr:NAD(P)H-dependent flavin oxidoreductase YrpB (nitropropane dioxygenase family) [Desulfurispira natronophila]